MLGAVIGDIVGSIYEFSNIRTKDFELFNPRCEFTDDSIMSLAVAKALLDVGDQRREDALHGAFTRNMRAFAQWYPHPMGSYGGRFSEWLRSPYPEPYNSWGNGSAMRVSACGFAATSLSDALLLAKASAEVTHNHPEGIAGAQVTAACIYLAAHGKDKDFIRKYVQDTYGELGPDVETLRKTYQFTERCRDSVPPALQCFFESKNFEDCLRNVISIGGDSDTLGAIAGGIAEAYYGIPEDIAATARRYLTPHLLKVLDDFEAKFQQK